MSKETGGPEQAVTYTPEEVRLMANHSDATQREMLLSYAALLEAMDELKKHTLHSSCVDWTRQRAAEILEAKR